MATWVGFLVLGTEYELYCISICNFDFTKFYNLLFSKLLQARFACLHYAVVGTVFTEGNPEGCLQ